MKRSIKIFTMLLGVVFFLSSCQEDYTNLEDTAQFEESLYQHTGHRNCALSSYMDKLESDPLLKAAHVDKMKKYKNYAESHVQERALCSNPTLLPVAVHYQGVSNPNAACLIAMAEESITALNQDYQGNNSDIGNWNQASSYFPGLSYGETCLEFRLGNQNHPSGFGLSNGDLAVTINQTSNDDVPQFAGYINIVVKPNTGYLGYSPLGGNGNGESVVVDAGAFGLGSSCGNIGASAPFNLGRTLTHEMGHYLLLDHIWGNGCNVDDGVSDTPSQQSENYSCPNLGKTSCGTNDMFMNYMDYVDDACMYMFSAGQSTRMENYVASNLSNVVNNASNVLGTSTGGGGGGGGSTACASPTNATATGITSTAATISWSDVPGDNKAMIVYKAPGGTWTRKTTLTNSATITGLTANTTYTYAVKVRCDVGGWQPYGGQKTFTTTGGGNTGGGSGGTGTTTLVKLRMKLDYYGSETTWEVVNNSNDQVVESGGPYTDAGTGRRVNKNWYLADGDYTFYIDDSYGDGICCDYGNGYVLIRDASNALIGSSDGNFGTYDYITITVSNGSAFFKSEDKDAKKLSLAKKAIFTTE